MSNEYLTTLEAVGDMMKVNGQPYFRLYQKMGFNDYTPLSDNLKHTEVTAETAFAFLKRIVEHYPAGKIFAVKLSSTASSNGEKVTGYIEFVMTAPVSAQPAVNNGFAGLGGLGSMDDFLGHIARVNQMNMELMEPRIKLAQLEANLSFREKELDRRQKELKEWEKELKQREEDRTRPLANGFGQALEKFFVGDGSTNKTSLAGAETTTTQEPPTAKEKMIEDIANKINDSSLELSEIAVIGEVSERIISDVSIAGKVHGYLKTV